MEPSSVAGHSPSEISAPLTPESAIAPDPTEAEVTLKGLSGILHRRREKRLERLERKTEFYRSIGQSALSHTERILDELSPMSDKPETAEKPSVPRSVLKTAGGRHLTREEFIKNGLGRLTEEDLTKAQKSAAVKVRREEVRRKTPLSKEERRTRKTAALESALRKKAFDRLTDEEKRAYRRWELLEKNSKGKLTAEEVDELNAGSDRLDDPYSPPPKPLRTDLMPEYVRPVNRRERRHDKRVVSAIGRVKESVKTTKELERIRAKIDRVDMERGGERIMVTPRTRSAMVRMYEQAYKHGGITREEFNEKTAHAKHLEQMRTGELPPVTKHERRVKKALPKAVGKVVKRVSRGISAEQKLEQMWDKNAEKYSKALARQERKEKRKKERNRAGGKPASA